MALPDELRALAAEVSNWGRWGDDDELGTLNLIDDAAVARGVAAARTGRPVPARHPARRQRPAAGQRAGADQPAAHDGGDQPDLHGRPRPTPASTTTPSPWACRPAPTGTPWPTSATTGCSTTASPPRAVTADRGVHPVRHPQGHERRQPGDPARRGPGQGRRQARRTAIRSPRPTSRRRVELAGLASRAGRHRARAHREDGALQGPRPRGLHARAHARAHRRHDPLDAPPRRGRGRHRHLHPGGGARARTPPCSSRST